MKKVTKKKDTGFRIFSIVLSVIILAVMAFLIYEIVTLGFFPSSILLPAVGILTVIGILAAGLQSFFTKGKAAKIVLTVLSCIVLALYATGAFYIFKATGFLSKITADQDSRNTTVQIIALADSPLEDQTSLNGQEVGVLSSISRSSTDAMISELSAQNISITQKPYDSIQALVNGLYDHEVSSIILNDSYRGNISDLEDAKFKNFAQDTKIIYSHTFTTKLQGTVSKVDDITTTPFTVLISGIDSRDGFSESSRSDVNMLATVNPMTKTVLLTSIPRDYYVATACDPDLGCQNGAMDKLTHTGLHTVQTTRKTLENLLGITINYTAQVNFSSVVQLVDALGGIDVNVAPGLAVDRFYTSDYFGRDYGVTEGVNHLNGEAALCYARERYAYADGDRQRVRNQQEVLMQIVKKATSPSVIGSFPTLMDAMSGAFVTDLSEDEIQSLVQFQLKSNPQWQFITYSLDGTGSTEFCAELGSNAYVMIPNEETVQTAKERIQAVLEGKTPSEVESISADPNAVSSQKSSETSTETASEEQDAPAAQEPVQQEPVYDEPVYQEPVYQDPTYQDPTYQEPVYQEPVYQEPVYQDPAADQGYGYTDPNTGLYVQ